MASDEDIRSFIEQQRGSGAFDSSGTFSVDLRKARKKSSLASQDVAGAHCLLWLQACSFGQPISVKLTYESAYMNGGLPVDWASLAGMARNEPRADRQRPGVDLLWRAVQACAALSEGEPRLRYFSHRDGAFELNLADGQIKVLNRQANSVDFLGVDFARKGTPLQRAEEAVSLQSRCGFSPCGPQYDSRSLTEENPNGYLARPPCTSLWNTYTHPSYLLALSQVRPRQKHSGFLVAPERNSQIPHASNEHSVFFLESQKGCQVGLADRVLAIPIGLEGTGQVRLIRYGVVLESIECDLGVPGAWAQVCVDDLQTDASGLKLIRDPAFDQLMAELKAQVLELGRKALEQLNKFMLPLVPEPRPGLMVRLLSWGFGTGSDPSRDSSHRLDSQLCRDEIRKRLVAALPGSVK
ncbi:MAG: hypothetical protein U0931_31235 [Vulcanimicrobiota bacterium]